MRVVVLGIDSYVGSNFIKHIGRISSIEAVGWAVNKSAGPDYNGAHVYGVENIANAVIGADIVVNLHETTDFSLSPDEESLYYHNVQIVKTLAYLHDLPGQHWKLIHLSTPYLQCSSRWPNVNGCETMPEEIPSARPFEAYCRSKQAAEEFLQFSNIDCIVLRPVPVYGQGDACSTITDMIKITSKLGFCPQIGDGDGVMQMMALDNLIAGLEKSLEKLTPPSCDNDESSESLHCLCEDSYEEKEQNERIFEIVALADDTKKQNFFLNFSDFIQPSYRKLAFTIPFLPIYFAYCIIAYILRLLNLIIEVTFMRRLPDPNYLYMNFHHWTFINSFKAREYLQYSDNSDKKDQINSTCGYYQSLSPSDIPSFSWERSRSGK